MKLKIGVVALALLVQAGVATAQVRQTPYQTALGFHSVEAPIGVRWWLNDKVALDGGLGFGSDEDPVVNESLSRWALDLGVPILLKSFDRLHFMVRPGLMFMNQEEVVDPGPPVDTDNGSLMALTVELEAEVFITENVSVSAAQGLAIVNNDPAVGESTSSWGTTGANFTSLGFHVYLFGKK